ncbi:hypothetical protein LCGC14_1321590 [marine sediment metagenome]|uniref:Uncharacterized protein n=1 Tax=marine sediment metagenome TaxID=412755 RepID=A0A0F9NLP5_9ZZZZ
MTAVTALSTLGGKVCMDSRGDELSIVRKADGTLRAGWLADISGETAVGINPTGNLDEFGGICRPRYDTDVDTAFTSTRLIDIVIPQGGHLYNIKIKDPGATLYAGEPLIAIASTAGALDKVGDIESEHVARIFDDVLDNTTFATVIWGV